MNKEPTFLDEVILSYVQRYKSIDYRMIEKYIAVPKTLIAKRVQSLLERGLLIADDEVVYCNTDKKYISWECLAAILKSEQEETLSFQWDNGYIPEKFKPE